MAAPPSDEKTEQALIFSTLSILQIIKDAQQQHGLRHGDYQRYRQYCGRRVGRVRRSLHYTNAHKYAGKHTKFQAKKIEEPELITDVKFLLVPLFDAERCWAYAMQLKQDAASETASSRTKFHMLKKLRKAVQHSANLERLCRTTDAVDPATKLEAQSYNAWMSGCLNFEMHQWTKAVESFSTAKKIYDSLCTVVTDDALTDAYKQRCAEMQPQLRYCAYETGDASALADLMEMQLTTDDPLQTDLDKLIAATRAKEAESRKATVKWCSHEVSLEQPEKVRQLHGELQQFDARIKEVDDYEQQIELYEKLLIDCRDAVQAVRDYFKQEHLKSHRQADDAAPSGAQLLHSYLTYVRLVRTNQKYLLMLAQAVGSSKSKPVDIVRLYDNLLQSLQEIEVLPGVQNDAAFVGLINHKQEYHKTFRCYYVAQTYAALKRWDESLAMFDRCWQRMDAVEQTSKTIKLSQADAQELNAGALADLRASVKSAKYTVMANRLYGEEDTGEKSDNIPIDKPLLDTPDVYRHVSPSDMSKVQIVAMPPKFEPMPSKPLFFDLALNHVKMPDLESFINIPEPVASLAASESSKKAKKAASPKGQAGKKGQPAQGDESTAPQDGEQAGVTGMLKGWFWGKQ